MENKRKRNRNSLGRKSSRTLILGLLAGGVLAGVGSTEVFAVEDQGTKTTSLGLTAEDEQAVKEKAQQLLTDIQKGKADTYSTLSKKGNTYTLSDEFSKKVESTIGFEEVTEKDTDTVKRLKLEQKGLSDLIQTKYDEAKSLDGVVQGVKGDSFGSGTLTKQVTVNEGEERLAVLTGELEALVEVKGILDTDLGDAKGIEDEIKKIEDYIKKQLEERLGGDMQGSFGLAEDGTLSITGDYIEYLNTLESAQGDLNVRSSFVQQTTKDSQVLASYYGQNSDLDKLIAEGFKYLDMPYVWGGESVSEGGFDCSGLLLRIFKDTQGIDIPRVTQDQQNFGKQVPLDELMPGDLVFWNTPATHVALYLGDGKIMEAANSQVGLRVRDVRLSELSSATRVKDFGISDSGTVVHITNAKRTVSYTPVLNREQSTEYNQAVSKTDNGATKAETDAKVKAIEQKAREDKAKQEKAKQEQAKQEQAKQEQAKQDKEKSDKAKSDKEKSDAEKAKLEKEKADKAKSEAEKAKLEKEKAEQAKKEQEEQAKKKAEEERLAQEKAEAEKAEQDRINAEKAEQDRINAEKAEQGRIDAEKAQEVVNPAEPVKEKAEPVKVEQPQVEQPVATEPINDEVVQE